MFHYFGYGSNMELASLRAKGVEPLRSERAALPGWRLRFNITHWFRHEGGVGNIVPSDEPGAVVRGVVHTCPDGQLERMDALESCGVGYDRVEVDVRTDSGETITAYTYVGRPVLVDDSCLPTRRYLNILVKGAESAGIDPDYVEWLRSQPVLQRPAPPPFEPPASDRVFDAESLARHSKHTALWGHVFDMSEARWLHRTLWDLFGGKDMTLFHLRRMDSSDGAESERDLREDRLTESQRAYLRGYLHQYAIEYHYAGRYRYE